jgi:alpha,alpha-trehalase
MMVRDVFEKTKDVKWLKKCLSTIEKEYLFWMTKHITPIGLNRYSSTASDKEKIWTFFNDSKRLGQNYDTTLVKTNIERIKIGSHFLAECETGWDFNPRFDNRCADFCPIDLNSNLYIYEKNFAYFYKVTHTPNAEKWTDLANERKALINKYMRNKNNNLYYDYDYVNNKLSTVYSAAVFNLLWSGMLTTKQVEPIVTNLGKLEFDHGISACEPGIRKYNYQWDYPNGWPCLQFLAVKGLSNYGYEKDAKRIAYKYTTTIIRNFEITNNLWEKYNIVDGSINCVNEYKMPTMMGWTAGTFTYLSDYLK